MAVGQLFSQRFSYGVHALAYIATRPAGQLTTLPELAAWMRSIWPGASETYLSNVVQRMARGRLLRSHRGIAGGYSLGRPATEISIRDVVTLLEGVDTNRCSLSLEDECPILGKCVVQRSLSQLEEAFLESLDRVKIADLAEGVVTPQACVAAAAAASRSRKKVRA